MPEIIDHTKLYRLPWSLTDNPIAWLEPTRACNLACEGCYRENVKEHKTIDEVQADLDTFARLRNFDNVSIAGGDPLLHPEIVEIVARVKRMGRKAIINTNGVALDAPLLRDLKNAGLSGLTFHVDSHQGRPAWRNKTEAQMNDLRSQYVEMVAGVGGLGLAFNATVYEDTLDQIPDVLGWAARNIENVTEIVFITYRSTADQFDYFVNGKPAEMGKIMYDEGNQKKQRIDITAHDVAAKLKAADPMYEPCAYLNGTHKADSFKWLLATRIGTKNRIHGYMGPRMMELSQTTNHLLKGRYLAYPELSALSAGRALLLGGWTLDSTVRKASVVWAASLLSDPLDALRTQHLQSVVCIQAPDVLEDGRDNMCDGCPDITVHDGKLVWSCRLEEYLKFGTTMHAVPKCAVHAAAPAVGSHAAPSNGA
jgi:hypothetical protein